MNRLKRPAMLNAREPFSWVKFGGTLLLILLCLYFLLRLIINELCFGVSVVGGSMKNTLQSGDFVYAYRDGEAKRGDIIVVDMTEWGKNNHSVTKGESLLYIKRLIGMEGDTLYCENGILYRKEANESQFRALEESYVFSEGGKTQPDFAPVTLGEGEIFMMGDNRLNSQDSRAQIVGCRKYEDILGVVPEWAITIKWYTTACEQLRTKLVKG